MTNYWINVVSKDHVLKGIEEGITQAGHGRDYPLNKMEVGDKILFYSPRATMGGTEKLQAFTALAEVADDKIYQVELAPLFKPFRRRVHFKDVNEVKIYPFIQHLSFIKNKSHWGFIFKLNLFRIPEEDFKIIEKEMVK